MNHIAFYRKYRPQSFNDVIGQEFVLTTLKNSIKNNKTTNAYIFAGPKGIGKTTIAKIFAKAINCTNSTDGDCCNTCNSCKSINDQSCSDVLELDAASNNGVDEVRKIINNVNYLPTQLKKKVYIIDEAHMLTTQAWNALLKTLEESPEHVVFIFSTTEMHKIPSTIVSRCQYFCFNKFTSTQIEQTINKVASAENIKITDEAKKTLVSLADGHARDVLSMFEQVAMLTDNNIDVESVNKIFGLVDINKKIAFINLISANNLSLLLNTLNEYIEKGINLEIFCLDLINILLDKIIYLQTSNFSLLKLLTKDNINEINLNLSQLFKLINIFEDKVTLVKTSSNAKFYLEKMLIEATGIFSEQPTPAASIPAPVIKEETKVQANSSSLPKLEDLFSIKEIKVNKQPTIVIEKKETIEVIPSSYTIKDVVYATASNCNSTIVKETIIALDKIKQSNNKVLKTLFPANKVLLSSKNSAILLFDDILDAELLNKNLNNEAFYEQIKSIIGKPMHFIGLTDTKFKEMIKEYMSGSKKDYKELVFSLKSKESVQDLFDKFLN